MNDSKHELSEDEYDALFFIEDSPDCDIDMIYSFFTLDFEKLKEIIEKLEKKKLIKIYQKYGDKNEKKIIITEKAKPELTKIDGYKRK